MFYTYRPASSPATKADNLTGRGDTPIEAIHIAGVAYGARAAADGKPAPKIEEFQDWALYLHPGPERHPLPLDRDRTGPPPLAITRAAAAAADAGFCAATYGEDVLFSQTAATFLRSFKNNAGPDTPVRDVSPAWLRDICVGPAGVPNLALYDAITMGGLTVGDIARLEEGAWRVHDVPGRGVSATLYAYAALWTERDRWGEYDGLTPF